MISFAKNIRVKFENESLFNKKYFYIEQVWFHEFFLLFFILFINKKYI